MHSDGAPRQAARAFLVLHLPLIAPFVAVNTGKCKDLKEKFAIQVWPTMVVLKDGKEVERIKGFKTEAALKAILEKHLGGAAGGDEK